MYREDCATPSPLRANCAKRLQQPKLAVWAFGRISTFSTFSSLDSPTWSLYTLRNRPSGRLDMFGRIM